MHLYLDQQSVDIQPASLAQLTQQSTASPVPQPMQPTQQQMYQAQQEQQEQQQKQQQQQQQGQQQGQQQNQTPVIAPHLNNDYSIVDETQSFEAFAHYLPNSSGNERRNTNIDNEATRTHSNTVVNKDINDINSNSIQLNTISETNNDNNNNNSNNKTSLLDAANLQKKLETISTRDKQFLTMSLYDASGISTTSGGINDGEETFGQTIGQTIGNQSNTNEQYIEERLNQYATEIEYWKEAYKALMSSKMILIDETAKEQNKLRNIIHKLSQQNQTLIEKLGK